MKNLNIFIFFVFSKFLICCQSYDTSEQNGSIIPVDISRAEGYISDEESAIITPNESEIIQLKCSSGIGAIEDLKFDKNRIILLSSDRQRIHILNEEGVCESEIFCLGKSSKEYVEITDFIAVDEKVYILDMSSLKILEYDYNGECKGVTNISDYWANSFFVLGEHFFLLNDCSNTQLGKSHIFEIEKDGTLVKSYIPFDNRPGLVSKKRYALCSDSTAFYAQRETNTIFKITTGKCEPFITLDYGKYNLPDKYKDWDARELMKNSHNAYEKYALGIESIQTSGELLFVRFQVCDNIYLLVINHKDKSTVLFCRGIAVKSMYHIGLMNYYLHENSVINVYDSDDFLNVVEHFKDNEVEDLYLNQLKHVVSGIQSGNNNPILIKYKLNHE